MSALDLELQRELDSLHAAGLYRHLREVRSPQGRVLDVQGEPLLGFSSNDYLGLAAEPALKEAAIRALERFGTGSGASRLICGSLAPHHELEALLAAFKGTEAALSFSTGWAAAMGVICALLGPGDVIVLDKLVHASIVDAARLCGARMRVFPHNDLNRLEEILLWARATPAGPGPAPACAPRVLIATESVFSMDGDLAPLLQMADLKDRHGAWLMVDEAHATGLYGPRRSGRVEAEGVSGRIEIQMATLGKAAGASGGCICGSRRLVDFLINRARSFIFSTAPPPAAAAAAAAGIRFIESPQGAQRCQNLWDRTAQCARVLGAASPAPSPILPVHIGAEDRAVAAAAALRQMGLHIPAIRYPTVARGRARLRVTVTASHLPADIERLGQAMADAGLLPPRS